MNTVIIYNYNTTQDEYLISELTNKVLKDDRYYLTRSWEGGPHIKVVFDKEINQSGIEKIKDSLDPVLNNIAINQTKEEKLKIKYKKHASVLSKLEDKQSASTMEKHGTIKVVDDSFFYHNREITELFYEIRFDLQPLLTDLYFHIRYNHIPIQGAYPALFHYVSEAYKVDGMNKGYFSYFLDVNLHHEKTGIVLGADIRKYDPRGLIVFVTAHSEMTYLTFLYKVEAMDYIIKDDFTDIQKRVIECIETAKERYMSDQNETRKRFQIKSGDKVISEGCDAILFFETSTQLHKIIMHSKHRQVEFYGKLKEIEESDDRFYRCHNSFVVNIDNIESIDNNTRDITTTNGEVCFASSRYFRSLKRLLEE